MPTAMTYAIETIIRLTEENTRLKMDANRIVCYKDADIDRLNDEDPNFVDMKEKSEEDNYLGILQSVPVQNICKYLIDEYHLHIYDLPPPTIEEVEKLKESADLIAESQQKQIDRMTADIKERMEDRERLVKDNDFMKEQLKGITDMLIETKSQLKSYTEHKGVGRPKKTECSPCISDPTP